MLARIQILGESQKSLFHFCSVELDFRSARESAVDELAVNVEKEMHERCRNASSN